MALRAGYYGIKRGLKAKLTDIAGAWDSTISKIFSVNDQAKYGSANLFNCVGPNKTEHNLVMTVEASQAVKIISSEAANAASRFPLGRFTAKANTLYFLKGCPAGGGEETTNYWLGLYDGSTLKVRDTGNGVVFSVPTDTTYDVNIRTPNGYNPGATGVIYKPQITYYSDGGNDLPFASYAMTNKELTDSAADQKTAINAIITAATGAADFAAFKAAMEAITPVTRSLNRTASPEDVPEEVIEEEKPVTKKTTKKIVKEGE